MTENIQPIKSVSNDAVYPWESHYPEGLKWDMKIEKKPLYAILDRAVEKFSPFPMINFMGKEWSYGEVGKLINQAARGLENMGIKKGNKVGLFLPNTPFSIIFYYAILKIGATVVNYNPLYTNSELEYQVKDSETDIMVTLNLNLMCDKANFLLKNTRLNAVIICPMQWALKFPKNLLFPLVKAKDIFNVPKNDDRFIKFSNLIKNDGRFTPVEIDPEDDIAVLQYTGGTTGVPKGAMLTHYNLYANTAQISTWLKEATPGVDSQIGVLPFFHVFAMTTIMNMSIWFGMKIYAIPKFELEEILDLIKKEKPTYFPAVPAIFNTIANHPGISDYDFSCLKFCLSGGAPLPPEVKKIFEERTKANRVAEGYGLTECSPVATCNPVFGKIKAGSIGQPIPNTVIEILDRDDGKTVLPLGKKGEVCIRGPQVMKGYYKRTEATADTIKNGRLHTGDVGYIDEEGYVYIVDRIKDLILVRGYNVYPRQVEDAIYEHPNVDECIVAGVPDKERGETVWAWVKPVDGRELRADDLKTFVKDKLSPIEMPRKFIIRTEPLPKTMVGKLSRKDLLEQEGIKRALT